MDKFICLYANVCVRAFDCRTDGYFKLIPLEYKTFQLYLWTIIFRRFYDNLHLTCRNCFLKSNVCHILNFNVIVSKVILYIFLSDLLEAARKSIAVTIIARKSKIRYHGVVSGSRGGRKYRFHALIGSQVAFCPHDAGFIVETHELHL